MSRLLALDWGRKRIGVAISDPSGILASPYTTLDATPRKRLLERIKNIINEENIECIIIGLPLNMDGSEGKSALQARSLADEVESLGIPVKTHDERLSSYEANRLLRDAGKKPSRNKGLIDRAAATLILQDFLDSK
ncbi:MAG: Holliday junction resolvase RuvX [Candidatus Electryonea clarkiae]|nr:Holliday junction resolvase RuvX [Candidatus Electryonea clarkiae]MDP8286274.1 Holliday junction resolvase RuvX [Candidatus Electryonea clarkiae]